MLETSLRSTVTPFVVSRDCDAFLSFASTAFDAVERDRVTGPDGRIGHAELEVGDSLVVALDAREGWPATPAFLSVLVEDREAVMSRAVAAGGRRVDEARVADPAGNVWWVMA